MRTISYARHRFPPDVIRHAVWLYVRFTLSYRDVEDLLAERGFAISNETIRRWVLKFGPAIARNLRRGRSVAHDRWHLDEMVVSIAGRGMYMWRAVDSEGEVLDMLVQPRRDKAAALKLLRKLLKRQGFAPAVIVTDKLRSYGAALPLVDSPAGTTRVCAPTTGPKTHISQYDEESARCRASSRRARPSASSPSTPPFTTSSTSSDIYFRGPPSTAFVLPLITPGTRRPLRLKGSRPRPQLRPTGVNVSKPSASIPAKGLRAACQSDRVPPFAPAACSVNHRCIWGNDLKVLRRSG